MITPSAVVVGRRATTAGAFQLKLFGPDSSHAGPDLSFKGNQEQSYIDFRQRRVVVGTGEPTLRSMVEAVSRGVLIAKEKQLPALHIALADCSKFTRKLDLDRMGVSLLLPEATSSEALSTQMLAREVATSAVTALYTYDRMKSTRGNATTADSVPTLPNISISGSSPSGVRMGTVIGNAINDVRSLGNLRPDEGTPSFYTKWIEDHVVTNHSTTKVCHVLRGGELKHHGLNLMHAVGKGAAPGHEPELMVTEYVGNAKSDDTIVLVGKGLTFDCGGMNVKPYGSMESMHQDMMGAAAVMGVMRAVTQLQLPINVVGVTAFAENAIGPQAYLPSTIIKSLNGKTVEILNTDAEGRLVLADALTFVQRHAVLQKKPKTIIDVATLTGAIVASLGERRAGLFSNCHPLAKQLLKSGVRSGEYLWPMPIGAEHTKAMRGGIADLVNCAEGRTAGACTAAAFLNEFIEQGMEWAHLDVAGPAMGKDRPNGILPAGPPGFGVRLLMDFLLTQGK